MTYRILTTRRSAGLVGAFFIGWLVGCGGEKQDSTAPASPEATTPTPAPARRTAPPPLPPELEAVTLLIARQQFDEAREQAEAWSAAHPDDGRSVFLIGLTWHRQRQYGQARPYFERALELSPDFTTIHHFFGYCLYNLGELDGAREQFEAHLAAIPHESDSHFGLGLVHLDQGNLDAAETAFLESIRLIKKLEKTDPRRYQARRADIAKARARLGKVYFQRGAYERARAELETALEIAPRHYSAYYTLSLAYRRLGDDALADEAMADYERVKQEVGR